VSSFLLHNKKSLPVVASCHFFLVASHTSFWPPRTPPFGHPAHLFVFLAYAGIHESSSLTDLRFVKKVDSRFHGNDEKKEHEWQWTRVGDNERAWVTKKRAREWQGKTVSSRNLSFVFPQPLLCLPATSPLSSRTQIRDPGLIWAPAFARVTMNARGWQWTHEGDREKQCLPATSPLSSRTQIRDPGLIWAPAFARVTKKRARVTKKRARGWQGKERRF